MATATRERVSEADVREALDAVLDPELDEPITDLGFVRSVRVDGSRVEVHLRLPTSFCSPNFAFLMASDAKDALLGLDGVADVVVELDDHHDSELINAGLASDAGYRGTFKHEAEHDLDGLRATFRLKAHTAAMERSLTALLREEPSLDVSRVRMGDLPAGAGTTALSRRRAALGLSCAPDACVLVDEAGQPVSSDIADATLRRARSVRISVDGNAHFCRGLLRTRYPGSGEDQSVRADDPDGRPLLTIHTLDPHRKVSA